MEALADKKLEYTYHTKSSGGEKKSQLLSAKSLHTSSVTGNFGDIQGNSTKRLSPENAERLYRMSPYAFRAPQIRAGKVFARGFSISAKSAHVKKETEEKLNELTFALKGRHWSINADVFGNGFMEIVEDGNDIVDLKMVHPKTIDFKRDASKKIEFDTNGRPVKYVQNLGGIGTKEIPLPIESIMHLGYFFIGDELLSNSLYQSIADSIHRELNIEWSIAESIWRNAWPRLDFTVGTIDNPPTEDQITFISNEVEDLNAKNEFVHGPEVSVTVLEPRSPASFDSFSKTFLRAIVSGTGVPEVLLLGNGEGTNKATADVQAREFQAEIENMQISIKHEVETKLFKKLAELRGWSEIPKLEWNEMLEEEQAVKTGWVVTLLKNGVITIPESRELMKFPPIAFATGAPPELLEPKPTEQLPAPVGEEKKPKDDGEEEKRGQKGEINPKSLPKRSSEITPTDAKPKAKGRDALNNVKKEFLNDLNEFFDFFKTTLINNINSFYSNSTEKKSDLSRIPVELVDKEAAELREEFANRLYMGLKFATKLGISSANEYLEKDDRPLLSKDQQNILDSYVLGLSDKTINEVLGKVKFEVIDAMSRSKSFDALREKVDNLFVEFGGASPSSVKNKKQNRVELIGTSELYRHFNNGFHSVFEAESQESISVDLADCENCEKCSSRKILSVEDAKGLLPFHPGCTCILTANFQ